MQRISLPGSSSPETNSNSNHVNVDVTGVPSSPTTSDSSSSNQHNLNLTLPTIPIQLPRKEEKDLTRQGAAVPPRQFACEECGMVFAKKSALSEHFVRTLSVDCPLITPPGPCLRSMT